MVDHCENRTLLVGAAGPNFGDGVGAAMHIITVNDETIQMPAGGQFDGAGRILTQIERGAAPTQTCHDVIQQGGIASHDQALYAHAAILKSGVTPSK